MSRNGSEWTRRPALPASQFVDPRIYTDEGIFKEEQQKIFDKCWLIACHESELPRPLDYRIYEHPGGHSMIIIRDEENKIRAFNNICPHRGNLLLHDASGSIAGPSAAGGPKRITCIFHAWAFDSRGNCVDIPREKDGYQDRVSKCDFSLREFRSEVAYGGFVWVTADDSASTLEHYLNGALDPLEEMLSEPLEVFHYHRAVVDSNYKLWHDTNSELYHDYLHYHNRVTGMLQPGYFDRQFVSYEGGHAQVTDMTLKYDAMKGHEKQTLGWPGLEPNRWALVDLFPGATFNIRAPAFRIDTVLPLGPDKLCIEYRGLGLKADTPEERAIRVRMHNSIWGPFGRNLPEDLMGVHGQGMALSDRSEAPVILHARVENNKIHDEVGMRHFYEEWSRRMGRKSSDPFDEM
ncbi:aromatic ring-hydroxylating oxygenase subunit alpha [Burkholderia cepacia]|uniref:Methanesulfonate monooxygenase, hydroxylase alpha subunit n=1 Tax=Burkholderia cepacia GG4 TaxID=1009846 RepID=A0A9W3PD16_BURCE|nr:aromatic ring-hydroxylating dioxygenase subunit alpha [Burkholderia cepacia]AFQ52196.1 Methanesulfonate monooxygenase, hydroxylase alpha subunit [Burkholderia cepacia GG4]